MTEKQQETLPLRIYRVKDKRMKPMLRPGSIVLVDTSIRRIEDTEWRGEYERPMYFVQLGGGYRCGWFQKIKSQLIIQPHALSLCAPGSWRMPEEAELVGKVVGIVAYFNELWACHPATVRAGPGDSNRTSL